MQPLFLSVILACFVLLSVELASCIFPIVNSKVKSALVFTICVLIMATIAFFLSL